MLLTNSESVNIGQLKFQNWLGKGSFGIVLRAELQIHGEWKAMVLKKSLENKHNEMTSKQFHSEQYASEHSRRISNPYAVKLLCPMIKTELQHLYLASEYVPGGDLDGYLSALNVHSSLMREENTDYPIYRGVHEAAARFLAAQFMAFFGLADEKVKSGEGGEKAIEPFLAWDIKLANVLITAEGGIKVGQANTSKIYR